MACCPFSKVPHRVLPIWDFLLQVRDNRCDLGRGSDTMRKRKCHISVNSKRQRRRVCTRSTKENRINCRNLDWYGTALCYPQINCVLYSKLLVVVKVLYLRLRGQKVSFNLMNQKII